MPIVGQVECGCGFFSAAGQTNEFLLFKLDSVCLPMFMNCGSFSIRSSRLTPHAKLCGTNPEIGARRVNFSAYSHSSMDPTSHGFLCL